MKTLNLLSAKQVLARQSEFTGKKGQRIITLAKLVEKGTISRKALAEFNSYYFYITNTLL